MSQEYSNIMGKTLIYVAISLLATFLGFLVGMKFIPDTLAYSLSFGLLLAVLIINIIFFFSLSKKRSIRFPMWYVYLYGFIQGLILYPVILGYLAQLGVDIVLIVFLGTILWVFLLGFLGLKTNGKFLKIGGILLVGLIIEIILLFIGILFFKNELFMVIISAFGVGLFSLYVIYDISALKSYEKQGLITQRDDLSIFVLNIYLDIVTIFMKILRILSYLSSKQR